MPSESFIKLYRQIMNWEWYHDINTFRLFVHLLLKANYEQGRWQGVLIQRGQHVTSRDKLAKETGLSVQQVRTSLTKLKSTNEITMTTTKTYTLITIVKYSDFQSSKEKRNQASNQVSNFQATKKQPTSNQQVTTIKERKEEKEEKRIYIEFVSLTDSEYQKLVEEHGEIATKRMIEILDNYKGANGKKYDSDYRAILNWVVKRYQEEVKKEPQVSQNSNPFLRGKV